MTLRQFRVQNFRSVEDSGWVTTQEITALIGTNESGKTNLLLALWKLNPAHEGKVDLLSDAPRTKLSDIRNSRHKPTLVEAEFQLSQSQQDKVSRLARCPHEEVSRVNVSRDLDGRLYVHFPDVPDARALDASVLLSLFDNAKSEIENLTEAKTTEGDMRQVIIQTIRDLRESFEGSMTAAAVEAAVAKLQSVSLEGSGAKSTIRPRFERLIDDVNQHLAKLRAPNPGESAEVFQYVTGSLPKFVYYSNYGNLDSEIYLPHVIENLKRDDLGSKEQARARTLKVLFRFVQLQPDEILELGQEFASEDGEEPTPDELEAIARNKRERSALLDSAPSRLTKSFREWWRQGDYVFTFQADGNFFKVWVSDNKRPERIELEGRSAGLQWFLSFYLVFLVESSGTHQNSILLLDEPGHSLHPLAQRDLSDFFENLASKNKILYTTHSPFLVDPDHLDRVKAVFVQVDGTTSVSHDLRAPLKQSPQTKSIYPVHAALGLSVSQTLMEGCQPVIVEGVSDQMYLAAIKTVLIRRGKLAPSRELIFVPAGGAKAVATAASILAGKDDSLPFVLFDADAIGIGEAKKLRDGVYAGYQDRVISTSEFVGEDTEVEDLLPLELIAERAARKLFRDVEVDEFDQSCSSAQPVVPQIEAYASRLGIELPKGWKAELATEVKIRMTTTSWSPSEESENRWLALFERLGVASTGAPAFVKTE
jgi:energy-coupling factor transporter ATP-binding protein EcfA2